MLIDEVQVEHSVDDSFSGSDISGHQGTTRRFVVKQYFDIGRTAN